jgi:hypothetical protein
MELLTATTMRIGKWMMTIYVRPDSGTGSKLFEVNI